MDLTPYCIVYSTPGLEKFEYLSQEETKSYLLPFNILCFLSESEVPWASFSFQFLQL